MVEKMEGWNPTCNRFIAFLDIMGFKDLVYRNNHEDVHKLLESFHPTIREIEKQARQISVLSTEARKKGKAENNSGIILPVSFSDSIILISSDDSLLSVLYLFVHIVNVLAQALSQGIPLKGAIAYGEQTADFKKSLHFGRPLIDAFELQNELQLYGVILHHTIEKYLLESKTISPLANEYIYKYTVPMKSGKINHYIIDWTILKKEGNTSEDVINKLYNNVSGSPRIYVDNTLEFVRWVTEKKAQLKQKK